MTPGAEKLLADTRALAVAEIETHRAVIPKLQAESEAAAASVRSITAELRGLQSAVDGTQSPAGLITGVLGELQDQLTSAKGAAKRAANEVESTRARLTKLETEVREIDRLLHPETVAEEAA